MPKSQSQLKEIALSTWEYEQIIQRLGREPNELELGLFGALWSEHCAYKHSRALLKTFPSTSKHLLVGTGTENAGVIDIGDDLAVVFKIESHNHPSAVEPFQGAATGIGGIVRDILAMGARPVALLNSLRFGNLDDQRQRYLFQNVVQGISWYGNCIGVPDVGGEITFDPIYSENPLVNAMCIGVVSPKKLMSSKASGPGNLLLLVGSDTGRDGIHGASGLASRSFEGVSGTGGNLQQGLAGSNQPLRSTVQVGNPFLEKVLIEACLEVLEHHSAGVVAFQDLGAAGLTSAAVECVQKGGVGFSLDVRKVNCRETGMNPYEIMLSESQERMLLIVKPGSLKSVNEIFSKWDLNSTVIGKVTSDQMIRVFEGRKKVAEVPVSILTDTPSYRLKGIKSPSLAQAQNADLNNIPLPSSPPNKILLHLLASSNLASRRTVYRQYDHQVGGNTLVTPGQADAAVIRVPSSNQGIALTVDGNGRYCSLDPYVGGAIAVAEACRNLSCVGAEPLAITDCLNFGNPEKPEIYYQLEKCIDGIADACKHLEIPVVSGNVSLYNETSGSSIYPTPVVGAVGLLKNLGRICTAGFKNDGDLVVLLGAKELDEKIESLSGSEYLNLIHNQVLGKLKLDFDREARVQRLCRRAISSGLLNSAHDCAEGGLGIALAESCILGEKGFQGKTSRFKRWDSAIFGETQSRIVVSLTPDRFSDLEQIAEKESTDVLILGKVEGNKFNIPNLIDVSVEQLKDAWDAGLKNPHECPRP